MKRNQDRLGAQCAAEHFLAADQVKAFSAVPHG